MRVGLVGLSVVGFLGFAAGGGYAYMESVAGPGEARKAIGYGVGNAAGVTGEAFAAPVRVLQEVKPALQTAASEASGVLGGAAGTTATTAAGEYGTPGAEGQP